MVRNFNGGFKIAVYARTVYVRRVVEPEGVIELPPALSRKASVHAATFSHFSHIEPSSGWVGHRRGEETAPCLGCLGRLPPEGGVRAHSFTKSVSGNPFLGGTDHWAVPPGDSPGGRESAPGANKNGPLGRDAIALPVGGSPVLPIFRTRSKDSGKCRGNRAANARPRSARAVWIWCTPRRRWS